MKARPYYYFLNKTLLTQVDIFKLFLYGYSNPLAIENYIKSIIVPLPIVSNISFNQAENYVVNEVIGGTGKIIHTGRSLLSLSISVSFPRSEAGDDPWGLIDVIQKMKENGDIINLGIAPNPEDNIGKVIAKHFNVDFVITDAPVSHTTPNMINMSISLRERGQVDVKKEKVNLVNLAPAVDLRQALIDAGLLEATQ